MKKKFLFIFLLLLPFLFIDNVYAKEISSVWEPFSNHVTTVNNTATVVNFTSNSSSWVNWGYGVLRFNFSIIKVNGSSTAPLVVPNNVSVNNYVCDVSTTSVGNSTFTGSTYSASCPMVMGSSGLSSLYIMLTDNQQNEQALYRITLGGLFTFEKIDDVSFDTSGIQNATNQQTQTITNNQNQNTQSIINNQNSNKTDIVNNQNQNTQSIINNQNQNNQALLEDNKKNFQTCRPSKNLFSGGYIRVNNGTVSNGVITSDTFNSSAGVVPVFTGISLVPNTYYLSMDIRIKEGTGEFVRITDNARNWEMVSSYTISNTYQRYIYRYTYDTQKNFTQFNVQFRNNVDAVYEITNIMLSTENVPYEKYGEDVCISKLDEQNKSIQEVNNTLNNDDVPSGTGTDFFNDFSVNNHGLSGIITAPIRLINSLSSSTCSPLIIPLPFVNNNVTLPCMSTIYNTYFSGFLTLYQLITNGVIAYWVLIKIFGHVKGMQNPEDDRIEVFDL